MDVDRILYAWKSKTELFGKQVRYANVCPWIPDSNNHGETRREIFSVRGARGIQSYRSIIPRV